MASRHNRIRIWMLGVLFFMLIGLGGIAALIRPKIEPDQVLYARFGDVIWNHELHARLPEIGNCQVCHHKEGQGVVHPKPCKACHPHQGGDIESHSTGQPDQVSSTEKAAAQDGEKTLPAMTAYHSRCIGCHQAVKKGPMICRDCHAQTFRGSLGVVRWDHRSHARKIDMGFGSNSRENCLRCHHEDVEAQSEADYRACRVCHKPACVLGLDYTTQIEFHRDLKHTDCARCHVQRDPSEGLRRCVDCHTGLRIDSTGGKAPSIEQAIHAECLECHHTESNKLDPKAPSRCKDCHRPDPSIVADLGVGMLFWDHDRHVEYAEGIDCATCHHADAPEGPHVACRSCHGTGLFENPQFVDALRTLCIGCHQEKKTGWISWDRLVQGWDVNKMFVVEAPEGKFFWNHREHALSWSFSCRSCHHPRLDEIDRPQPSHDAEGVWAEKKSGPASCRQCHPSAVGSGFDSSKTDFSPNAPVFIDTLKKICLECHQSLGGGPQSWNDFFEENAS